MATILITEFMDERAVALLRAHHTVEYDPALVDDGPRMLVRAPACDALVVRNRTQVRGPLLDALVRCRIVGRLGVGLDNIDVATCQARGIEVVPATGANASSVAEYVLAAAMVLLRGAYLSTAAVAAGEWPRAALGNGREAAGKTLGIVGFGIIGQATARLAKAVGMRVVACDALLAPSHPTFPAHGVDPATLDELVAVADAGLDARPVLGRAHRAHEAGRGPHQHLARRGGR
jgi:(S)-sulfolactate dehydrogenase